MADEKSTKRNPRIKELTGRRFGRLIVLAFNGTRHNQSRWLCACDCGNTKVIHAGSLVRGLTTSCGCFHNECLSRQRKTHGKTNSPEYVAWCSAKDRCFNPDSEHFACCYGGRGITMCPEWAENFQAFYEYIGPRPKGTTLDRINVNGHYEPGNVRWATKKEQMENRRHTIYFTHEGLTLSLKEWSERTGLPYRLLSYRLRHKYKQFLLTPVDSRFRRKS